MTNDDLPRYTATRYLQPLREGGSLPAVVDTDGGGLFVVKFRGAGQGPKVLIAELVVGLLATAVGLPGLELAIVEILPAFGRSEPDPEIQDILGKSHGINVGLRYLDGAFNFDASAAGQFVSGALATRLVWFDAFVTNPDRTHRNPNLLVWNNQAWLIDHGAALYAHHDWSSVDAKRTGSPFPLIKSHVLLEQSGDLQALDVEMRQLLTASVIDATLARVPDALLTDDASGGEFASGGHARRRYREYLLARLDASHAFVDAAIAAQQVARLEPKHRVRARR